MDVTALGEVAKERQAFPIAIAAIDVEADHRARACQGALAHMDEGKLLHITLVLEALDMEGHELRSGGAAVADAEQGGCLQGGVPETGAAIAGLWVDDRHRLARAEMDACEDAEGRPVAEAALGQPGIDLRRLQEVGATADRLGDRNDERLGRADADGATAMVDAAPEDERPVVRNDELELGPHATVGNREGLQPVGVAHLHGPGGADALDHSLQIGHAGQMAHALHHMVPQHGIVRQDLDPADSGRRRRRRSLPRREPAGAARERIARQGDPPPGHLAAIELQVATTNPLAGLSG